MIFIDDETRQAFVKYALSEINDAELERKERKEKWIKWRQNRASMSEDKVKTSPYPKSANMVVPLTAILTNGIYASLLSSLMQRDPPFTMKSIRETSDDLDLAEIGTKYYSIMANSKRELDLKTKQKEVTYEAVSMGTQFVKVPWTHEEIFFKERTDTGEFSDSSIITQSGPEIVPILHEDILYRSNDGLSLQRQPWVAHIVHLAEHELKNREDLGYYENTVEVMKFKEESKDMVHTDETVSGKTDLIDLYEVHCKYDVDGDGRMEEIIVTIHREAEIVLREEFNKFGIRPFEAITYMVNPGSVEGKGVCEMCEGMQEEATTFHRMRTDSAHISGLRMLQVRKGSGIKANEKIYPGKLWFVEQIGDIAPLQTGEVYPSSLQAENMAVMYAQKVTGFSDVMGGFADQTLRSRDTFSGQALRLSEGKGLSASVSQEMRDKWSNIAMLVLFQLIAHKKEVLDNEKLAQRLTEEEQAKLEKLLNIPVKEIPMRFAFTVSTTPLDQTFETKRQNMLALTQLYNQFVDKTLQWAITLAQAGDQLPQDVRERMIKAITGSSRLHEHIFELFDLKDTQKFIPEYKTQEMILKFRDLYKDSLRQQMEEEINATGLSGNGGTGNTPNEGGGLGGYIDAGMEMGSGNNRGGGQATAGGTDEQGQF